MDNNNKKTPFTENGQGIYDLAFRIGHANNSFFIGTEHLLLAILTKKDPSYKEKGNRTCAWLRWAFPDINLEKIISETKDFIKSTSVDSGKISARQNLSPSLSRALKIATRICNPCGSEHLLAGILLAKEMDSIANAACSIISNAAGKSIHDRNIQTKLINALDIPNEKISIDFPKRNESERFHFQWCYEIKSNNTNVSKDNNNDKDNNNNDDKEKNEKTNNNNNNNNEGEEDKSSITVSNQKINVLIENNDFTGPISCTHYISKNICCGSTPGRMNKSQIYDLVTKSNINAFLCLQESYEEYGCRDYRKTLDELLVERNTKEEFKNFPSSRTFKFLHAPIADFSIMDDNSLLGLIAEIQKYIEEDPENNVLYIHCYGGHGRTGTVLTNLIMAMNGCKVVEALDILKQKHKFRFSCRNCALSFGELEAEEQTEQSFRMKPAMTRQNKMKHKKK